MSKPIRHAAESSAPDILAWRIMLFRRIGVFIATGLLLGLGVFLGGKVLVHLILTARQNHVYCDLVKPGMSKSEIDNALLEIGEPRQFIENDPSSYGRLPSEGLQNIAFYRIVYWKESRVELNYNLWLWLGYNAADHLVWAGRQTAAGDVVTIRCPWTLGENLATQ